MLEEGVDRRAPGGAARWFLHHALASLARDLEAIGGRLDILRGDPRELVPALAHAAQAERVVWSRRYDGAGIALDAALNNLYWDQVGLILGVIFAVVVVTEIVTSTIRSRII